MPLAAASQTSPDSASIVPARAEIVTPAEWDAALDLFHDVNYEQTSTFVARQWGERSTVCVLVRAAGRIVGGTCYGLVRVPFIGAVGFAKFGPVWRPHNADHSPASYRRVVDAICRHARDLGIAMTFVPRAHTVFTDLECAELLKLGFSTRHRVNGDHYIVDASLSEKDQLASLTQKGRANVVKAEKSGLTISEIGSNDYAAFETLYAQMMERKHVLLLRPIDVVPDLDRTLPERLRPHVLIAYHDGEPVAGTIYGILGDTVYSLYTATNDKAPKLRAGYKLHWEVLNRVRGMARWYDLGSSSGDQGMHWFKEGFVGKKGKIVVIPHEFDYASGLRAKLALRIVYGAREVRRTYLRVIRSLIKLKPSP